MALEDLMQAEVQIEDLLRLMVEKGASDLHLKAGSPPMLRIDGELIPAGYEMLTPDHLRRMIESILTEQQKAEFIAEKELDLAYSVPGLSRFRVNVYLQRGTWGAALRVIPARPFTIEELRLPPILKEMAVKPRGLILVTGPTGSGKSTTLAAMLNHVNENRRCHIVTIEDPIEFLHKDKLSVISQREVGPDTHSFSASLTRVLRQDPNVILIGEMRDLETISVALTAAETGHVVLATLHTSGAAQTIDRVVDVFPPHQQQQIRMQLAASLEGVMSQALLQKAKGAGRSMAMEILTVTPAVRNVIREGKTHQIPNLIQAGAQYGMISLDQSLKNLYQQGLITYEEALSKCSNPDDFNRLLGRAPY
jgi:twitching motility protein PilT